MSIAVEALASSPLPVLLTAFAVMLPLISIPEGLLLAVCEPLKAWRAFRFGELPSVIVTSLDLGPRASTRSPAVRLHLRSRRCDTSPIHCPTRAPT